MRFARTARGLLCVWFGACSLVTTPALAAPVEGVAAVALDPDASARDRERAIAAARKAALEQAIAGIADVEVDPTALQQVLAQSDSWTAAYRILEVGEQGGQLQAKVEVDIDVPRLRKRLAKRDAASRP